jgi:hypothetical protein
LRRWSARSRASNPGRSPTSALVELIRLRAAPAEREFALRAREHDALRHALAAAARARAAT